MNEDADYGFRSFAAKVVVLEVALGTLIHRLLSNSPNPREDLAGYLKSISDGMAEATDLYSRGGADWAKSFVFAQHQFEQMLQGMIPEQEGGQSPQSGRRGN